ncbi:Class I SAM-dependent methyltransferase OS=Streptomyces microflavus OX=1919 GN=HUT09_12595 PE=4 SV=1 [Streptomyces microflavus]
MRHKPRVLSRSMAWRNAVNGVLQQLTGYQLRRVTVPARTAPAESLAASTPAPAPPKPEAEEGQAKKPETKEEESPRRRSPPRPSRKDYDDRGRGTSIRRRSSPDSMPTIAGAPQRLHPSPPRYIARHNIPGDIIECGVWRGGLHAGLRPDPALRRGDRARAVPLRHVRGCMTEPSRRGPAAPTAARRRSCWTPRARHRPIWAVASLDDVKAGFENGRRTRRSASTTCRAGSRTRSPGRRPKLDLDPAPGHRLGRVLHQARAGAPVLPAASAGGVTADRTTTAYWQSWIAPGAWTQFLDKHRPPSDCCCCTWTEGRIAVKP